MSAREIRRRIRETLAPDCDVTVRRNGTIYTYVKGSKYPNWYYFGANFCTHTMLKLGQGVA